MATSETSVPKMIRSSVTQDHINRGRPYDGCDCPIAIAFREKYGFKFFVADEIEMYLPDKVAVYVGTEKSYSWTSTFDNVQTRSKCKPSAFAFKLHRVRDKNIGDDY